MGDKIQIIAVILSVLGALILVLIGFFAFVGTTLMAIVGYFVKAFHGEWKADKKDRAHKEKDDDERMGKMATEWGAKLTEAFDKIMARIDALPKGSETLNTRFLTTENECLTRHNTTNARIDSHQTSIQNEYNRVEELAKRVHILENHPVAPDLHVQQLTRSIEKFMRKLEKDPSVTKTEVE